MPNIFSKKVTFSKSKLPAFGQGPEGDWKIIFTVAALIVLVGIAVNIFIFIKIDKGEIFVAEEPATEGVNTLDLAELEKTVDYYKNKSGAFENILQNSASSTSPDPSI